MITVHFTIQFRLFLTGLLSAVLWRLCDAHAQCLDGFPPFRLEADNVFCAGFREFGCCSVKRNNQLMVRYLDIVSKLSQNSLSLCADSVKQILCQQCSPYSAQIYQRTKQSDFPSLCDAFCKKFYDSCRWFVKYLTVDGAVSSVHDRVSFCGAVRASNQIYCYPDVTNHKTLQTDLKVKKSSTDQCLCLKEFARDLRKPLLLTSPKDGSRRIFLAHQHGEIFAYHENGTRFKGKFLDISDVVHTSDFRGDQRGLLGLAFHSNFHWTRRFYVYFTMKSPTGGLTSRISEVKVMDNDVTKANLSSIRTILDIEQPSEHNNAGQLIFGQDGYLYAFIGDGHSDPVGNTSADLPLAAQNRSNLLGSVIRIDVDRPGHHQPYSIPPDNPFVGVSGVRPEIYAYGFRNPVHADQDEGDPTTGYGRGRILTGDVGQDSYEEINEIRKGANYGWSVKEGTKCHKSKLCDSLGDTEGPIYQYNHTVGRAVQGGHLYRGCLNPNLQGLYIYGDYYTGKLFGLREDPVGSDVWKNKELFMCHSCPQGLTNAYQPNILGFGQDFDGEIYLIANHGGSATSGRVYKVVDPRRRGDPHLCRSNRNQVEYVDVAREIHTQSPIPHWLYWLMSFTCLLSFLGGLLTFYCLIRHCPRWASYRRLIHRSDQQSNQDNTYQL